MEILKIENLSKSYGAVKALQDINLNVEEKEIVSIIGPSGSGKSTLLRLISNLEKVDLGSVTINNEDLVKEGKYSKDSKKVIKNLGMIFQDYSLFDNLTIKDNIELAPLYVLNKTKEEAKEISTKLLEQVGLVDKLLSYPSQLSGGQKQRIAIARSLAMKPKILLIDEPTSALDIESINDLVKIIKDLQKENITTIIVTHDIDFAKKVSTRLVFIEDSSLLFDVKIEDITTITDTRLINFINKK